MKNRKLQKIAEDSAESLVNKRMTIIFEWKNKKNTHCELHNVRGSIGSSELGVLWFLNFTWNFQQFRQLPVQLFGSVEVRTTGAHPDALEL